MVPHYDARHVMNSRPSHCPSKALTAGIVADQNPASEKDANVRFGSKADVVVS
jgi:hypothetical protein